jgi:hypothetical protein
MNFMFPHRQTLHYETYGLPMSTTIPVVYRRPEPQATPPKPVVKKQEEYAFVVTLFDGDPSKPNDPAATEAFRLRRARSAEWLKGYATRPEMSFYTLKAEAGVPGLLSRLQIAAVLAPLPELLKKLKLELKYPDTTLSNARGLLRDEVLKKQIKNVELCIPYLRELMTQAPF